MSTSMKETPKKETWTTEMDTVLIDAFLHQLNEGHKVQRVYTSTAYANITKELTEKFQRPFQKDKVKGRWKVIKTNFHKFYDNFKNLCGFVWNSTTKRINAEPEIWQKLIENSYTAKAQPEMDMEAFYASLESETIVPSHASLSEETKKAIKILQGLMSKDFPHLFHPGRSIVMKDTLKYLLNLPPHEGFSITTKSEIKRLLQRFTQLMCNYSHMYSAKTSKGETEDMCLHILLARLEKEKTKLEEKINAVKIQIANSTERRDVVAKRKTEVLKARRDELLIAENEFANIEVEWLVFRDQFIRKTCFKEWIY